MAIRGSRISLPLAVGVDCNHPQWLNLSLFFFFLSFVEETKMVIEGGQIYLFFFFLSFAEETKMTIGGGRIYLFFFFLVVRQRDENGHRGWPDLSLFLF
jgi:hypothetical protein